MRLVPRSREGNLSVPDFVTVRQIETIIKKADLPPKKDELRSLLPRPTTPHAFDLALDHLIISGKVFIDRHQRVVWVAVDNPKLKTLLDSAKEIA